MIDLQPTLKRAILLLSIITFNFYCKEKTQSIAVVPVEEDSSIYQYASSKDSVRLSIPNYPLRSEKDLDIIMQQIGDAKIVLLGEATHGTAEFYNWRAALTKRLIKEKGFNMIASESEWADSYKVNNFIKGPRKDSAASVQLLHNYDRWPTWMWGNYEIASLVTWLNHYNQTKTAKDKVGFFGLDVYCLWESMTEVMPYIKNTEASLQKAAQNVHTCFKPYNADAQQYALAVASMKDDCRKETNNFWKAIQKLKDATPNRTEADFVVEQNAMVALNGERYYRAMVESGPDSWNIRDNHMTETLKRLLSFHGANTKAIVWEHNTHVGDARYTDMAESGEVNVGQLVRKEFGENNVFIVGFGTYQGTVIAAKEWGSTPLRMEVPKAQQDSWEDILHKMNNGDKIIISKEISENKFFKKPIGHRAIGVVYHPDGVQFPYFVPSVMPRRYDAFIFIENTSALHPIKIRLRNEPPDLYPSGS